MAVLQGSQWRTRLKRAPYRPATVDLYADGAEGSLWRQDSHPSGRRLRHRGGTRFISFTKALGVESLSRLGLADQLINTNESQEKAFVYSRGQLRPLPDGLVVVAPKSWSILAKRFAFWGGITRMGLDFVISKGALAEDESLASFFSRRFGMEAFERLIEPLMAGIYAGDADDMSIRATFPRFVELEQQYGSLLRGMLAAERAEVHMDSQNPRQTTFVTLQAD